MIGAGLLARNAVARGLTTQALGEDLAVARLAGGRRLPRSAAACSISLDALGFQPTGFGCMTCMGNSGPLAAAIAEAIESNGLATAWRCCRATAISKAASIPRCAANFLASPPLVVAYALAGTRARRPRQRAARRGPRRQAGVSARYLAGRRTKSAGSSTRTLTPELFRERYATVLEGTPAMARAARRHGSHVRLEAAGSTFIRRPPFFDAMTRTPQAPADIRGARVLAHVRRHVHHRSHLAHRRRSRAGTPAAEYLASLGIAPRDFVNYAARRLNHDVMIRGTFANMRVRNEMTPDVEGSSTRAIPRRRAHADPRRGGERIGTKGVPLVVVAGAEYGAGSSRDWAAKGTRLLGVRAVIAEIVRAHPPLQPRRHGRAAAAVPERRHAQDPRTDGAELFDIAGISGNAAPRSELRCTIARADGARQEDRICSSRLDTRRDVDYFRHGGLLHYVVRHRLPREVTA